MGFNILYFPIILYIWPANHMYIIIGGLNIGNFWIKFPIAKAYSLPIFHLTREIFVGKKLANLANREPFAKISSPVFTDIQKAYMAYALTVANSPNFSSPIAFTCTVHQNFLPPNIFHVRSVCIWYIRL